MYKNTVTSTPLSLPALNVDGADGGAVEKKRMLLITNPHASTVNARLHGLVQYALAGRYSLEAMTTTGQGHAPELSRQAASEGYDVVVVFAGDGTINEAANGVIGTSTALTTLPAPHVVVGRLPPWVSGARRPDLDPALVDAAGRLGLRLAAAVRYCIDETGQVTDAVTVEPSDAPGFDDALVGVVRTWVLEPYRVHGKPTPVCGFMAHRVRTRAAR